jgi:tetratricopeptide (TPR) repeat protein
MSFRFRFVFFICAVLLSAALSSCSPDQNSSDEEKEPHFVLGQSRINAMDYQGAIEAFEESLEVNPHSAQAHYQLAMLYDTKVPDPAAAIYHYEQYLKFDPNAPNASIIRQRIEACKQQLAADVLALPASSATQQQLENLIEQNRQLQDEVNKWRAYYASQMSNAVPQNVSILSSTPTPTPIANSVMRNSPEQNNSVQTSRETVTHSTTAIVPRSRTITVASGETAMAICRKHDIKLNALEAANPGINLSKLRVGQVLNLP